MTDQECMDAYLDKTMIENNVNQKDQICGRMQSIIIGCSFEEKTLSLGFPIQPWQANRAGLLHGGIICTAMDMTAATLARFFAGENYCPTVSLDVKYIRPVEIGDTMIVTVKGTAVGRRITQIQAEAISRNTGKLVATGSSVFMNVDIVKERQG